jgi:O-antigen ligase
MQVKSSRRNDHGSWAHALTAPGTDAAIVARALAVASVLLIVSAAFKFRVRSADLALQGNVDSQVLVELALFAAAGVWILLRRLISESSGTRPRRRLADRSPLRVMRIFALVALVTSAWSPTSIASIRAVQYVIAVEFFAEVVYVCWGKPHATETFWRTFSAGLLIATGLAAILTLAPGSGFTPWLSTFQGVKRLRFLTMHPIATADLLGLVAIVTWEPLLRARILGRARRLASLSRPVAKWLLALAAIGALVLTHERTSTLAGFAAVGVYFVSTRNRGRAQLAAVWAFIALTVGVLFFDQQLQSLALRGQTTNEVASLSGRNQILSVAWNLFAARPFIGWGYLSGRSIFLPIISWAGESHDVLAEIGVSFGFLGLALFGCVFFRWWRLAKIGRRSAVDHQRLFAVRSTALVVLVLIIGFASDSFAGPPGLPVMALLLGLALAELSTAPTTDDHTFLQQQGHAPQDAPVSWGFASQLAKD